MPPKRRSFKRKTGTRRYKKLYIISTEGQKTEQEYFSIFDNRGSIIRVKCLKSKKKSSPLSVLKRMKDYIKEENLLETDEAWLVVDRDEWTDKQLKQLHDWAEEKENYGFALSNPKFEYWLLLHFEDGKGVKNSKDCTKKLKKYLPNYDKGVDVNQITDKMIHAAVKRAKDKDKGSFEERLKSAGSTVYKVVEKIVGKK
ncbi:MAG: RloB domain-containing protein [Candidatus Delongbacteria bacterium]|nr:RloB domain-containing protein [Candidatus Delongbacteria bacterium]